MRRRMRMRSRRRRTRRRGRRRRKSSHPHSHTRVMARVCMRHRRCVTSLPTQSPPSHSIPFYIIVSQKSEIATIREMVEFLKNGIRAEREEKENLKKEIEQMKTDSERRRKEWEDWMVCTLPLPHLHLLHTPISLPWCLLSEINPRPLTAASRHTAGPKGP